MAITLTGTTTHTKTLIAPSSGVEDKVYGSDYVSLTSHSTAVAIAGLTANEILYAQDATTITSSSLFKFDGTTLSAPRVSIAAGALTTDVQAANFSATLNNAGVTFTAPFKFDITETAQGAASSLFRIRGGVAGATTYVSLATGGQFNIINTLDVGSVWEAVGATGILKGYSTGILGFTSGAVTAALDTAFSRVSAGVMGLGTGAQGSVAGTLSLSTIELGHATDTTLSRSAAGVLAVEGVVIPSISSTNTLTNKRVTPRITTISSEASPTFNTDNCDILDITAQAADITSMTTNQTGTPTEGQKLIIRIKGTAARAITWGTLFAAGTDVALPTTTTTTTTLICGFIWNSGPATDCWQIVAKADGFT